MSRTALAQEDDDVVTLDDLEVTAPRPPDPKVEVVSGTALSAESQSKTVEGLLRNMAGIDLNRRAPAGSENRRLSIRGFDESRVKVLLDGRSLHGAGVYGGYYVDWASLSLESVEAVEVIRGIAPAKYGNTLGGIVDVVTGEPVASPQTTARTTFGSRATWDIQASFSTGIETFRYGLGIGQSQTEGYLRNSFVDRETYTAKATLSPSQDLKVVLGGRFTTNECGMTAGRSTRRGSSAAACASTRSAPRGPRQTHRSSRRRP
jgi:iron complex outermembrane receptor protein